MKKRGFVLSATAALTSAIALVGIQLASPGWAGFRSHPKEVVDEVWQTVNREFVDATFNKVDWEAERLKLLNKDYATAEDAYTAIRESLKLLGDPYTRFMDPEQYASMQIDTSGELTGVGLTLGMDEEKNQLIVISPIEDSPAARLGVKSKDVITAIDGKTTQGMDVNTAVGLIRGPVGTTVTLSVERGTEKLSFAIRREKIELATVRSELQEVGGQRIGYIRLTQFSANAAEKMQQAIQTLEGEKVDGYILDLRSNPGGLLHSSAEIARMWLDQGSIVSTINRQGEQDRLRADHHALTTQPLVVLVDGASASASEILSGALQDNRRATIVGTKTFGKGLVQSVHALSDGSGLAVTIARYRTPNGTDIHEKGIMPDIVVELTEEDIKRLTEDRDLVATPGDPQYAAALRALQNQIVAKRGTSAQNPPAQSLTTQQ
ncbi:MAG: S41 family peptidase [Synechococcales cyanobacterium]